MSTSILERRDGVTPGYRHIYKRIQSAPCVEVGDTTLKWYDLAPADAPIPDEVRELARRDLQAAAEDDTLGLSEELGFVILHRCGRSFYFLLVSTWRNDNELWETVWAKTDDAEGFHPWPLEGSHRPTFCVWELGAVWHEQQAWSRFLRTERGEEDREAYLRDSGAGAV